MLHLFNAYRAASVHATGLANNLHATNQWPKLGEPSTPAYSAYIHALRMSVGLHSALGDLRTAYLATLPPLPRGYYLASCAAPEGGCLGWHVYRHNSASDATGSYEAPTGEFYCNGGDGQLTAQWLEGTLPEFDSLA